MVRKFRMDVGQGVTIEKKWKMTDDKCEITIGG